MLTAGGFKREGDLRSFKATQAETKLQQAIRLQQGIEPLIFVMPVRTHYLTEL